MSWEGLNPPYSCIVADPPWDHSDGTGARSWYPLAGGAPVLVYGEQATVPPYSSMSVREIECLDVTTLAAADAHLYLWTTNRFLRDAFAVAETWGFTPKKPLVWCKSPKAPFLGGPFGGSSVEFCLFATRGSLRAERAGRQWWEWPRGSHSAKPQAFLDVVERVSPGPYVELFARAPRLGWDHWGLGYESERSA